MGWPSMDLWLIARMAVCAEPGSAKYTALGEREEKGSVHAFLADEDDLSDGAEGAEHAEHHVDVEVRVEVVRQHAALAGNQSWLGLAHHGGLGLGLAHHHSLLIHSLLAHLLPHHALGSQHHRALAHHGGLGLGLLSQLCTHRLTH